MKVYALIGTVDYEGDTALAVVKDHAKALRLVTDALAFKRDYHIMAATTEDDVPINKWLKKNKPPIADCHIHHFSSFRVVPFELG